MKKIDPRIEEFLDNLEAKDSGAVLVAIALLLILLHVLAGS